VGDLVTCVGYKVEKRPKIALKHLKSVAEVHIKIGDLFFFFFFFFFSPASTLVIIKNGD
jgi:hypothetical protein